MDTDVLVIGEALIDIVESAEGDAARFSQVLTEYKKAPQVTRDRLYLETMQQVFTNTSKVLVDTRNGSNLLYLPLDKLIQSTAVQPAAVAAEPAAVTRPATSPSPSDSGVAPPRADALSGETRTRESMRNRERGER